MPTRPSRRASLRAPFVVTVVAASALVTACGGRAEVDPISIGDAGSDAIAKPDVGPCVPGASCNPPPPPPPPPPAGCPVNEPAAGVACTESGKRCSYEDVCPIPTRVVVCTGGVWVPEHPGGLTYACPPVAPQTGTSCFVCDGEYPKECDYNYCGSTAGIQAFCNPSTQQWYVVQGTGSCNPPPPPPPPPIDGGNPPPPDAGEPGDDDAPNDPPNLPGGNG